MKGKKGGAEQGGSRARKILERERPIVITKAELFRLSNLAASLDRVLTARESGCIPRALGYVDELRADLAKL